MSSPIENALTGEISAPSDPQGNGTSTDAVSTAQETERLVLVQVLNLDAIQPAPENDEIYGVVSPDDPEVIKLAQDIKGSSAISR